jgi:hypothetical protein
MMAKSMSKKVHYRVLTLTILWRSFVVEVGVRGLGVVLLGHMTYGTLRFFHFTLM